VRRRTPALLSKSLSIDEASTGERYLPTAPSIEGVLYPRRIEASSQQFGRPDQGDGQRRCTSPPAFPAGRCRRRYRRRPELIDHILVSPRLQVGRVPGYNRRCRAAGIGDEVTFACATKPCTPRVMLDRALARRRARVVRDRR
jgi:hypothetical protein